MNSQVSHYELELFAESCAGLTNITDIKVRLLRQRGFICRSNGAQVELIGDCATDRDRTDFEAILKRWCSFEVGVAGLGGHKSRKLVTKFAQEVWRQTKTTNGMAGRPISADFFRTEYGAKVDVAHLDLGIALLVKAVPLIGVTTWQSCDGHHGWQRGGARFASPNRAWLDCWDANHAAWLSAALVHLARSRSVSLTINPSQAYSGQKGEGAPVLDESVPSQGELFFEAPNADVNSTTTQALLRIDRDGSRVWLEVDGSEIGREMLNRDLLIRQLAEKLLEPDVIGFYRSIRPRDLVGLGNIEHNGIAESLN
jgi:hypothetical protein